MTGAQLELSELEKRDEALGNLEANRAELINVAKLAARRIAAERGEVTSPDVVADLRARGYLSLNGRGVDLRFMGAVFRKGWRRKGWLTGKSSPGSHARPVAIWELDQ